jgi:DNA invertase Pin-like site-specific DNA recombinase
MDKSSHSLATKAGLERARAAGVKLGGRRIPDALRQVIRDQRGQGLSFQRLASSHGLSLNTVRRICAEDGVA